MSTAELSPLRLILRSTRLVMRHPLLFWLGQIGMVSATIAGLVVPLFTRSLIDALTGGLATTSSVVAATAAAAAPVATAVENAVAGSGWGVVFRVVAPFGAALLALAVLRPAQDYVFQILSHRLSRDLRSAVFAKVNRLTIAYFDANPSGQTISMMTNDIAVFHMSFSQGIVFILTQVLSLIFIIAVLAGISLPMTLLTFAVAPILLITTSVFSSKQRTVSKAEQEQLSMITRVTQEALRGIATIKSYVLESHARRIFGETNDQSYRLSMRGSQVRSINSLVTGVAITLSIVGLVLFGTHAVSAGDLSIGNLVAFLLYAQMLAGPISALSGIAIDIQRALAAAARIFSLLDAGEETGTIAAGRGSAPAHDAPPEPTTVAEPAGGSHPAAAAVPAEPAVVRVPAVGVAVGRPAIEAVGVGFDYPGSDAAVLRDVGFTLPHGIACAVVGPSGAGKSTLFRLLLGFYQVTQGSLSVFGRDINDYNLHELRSLIGIVSQEPHLFDLSLRDNILCGRPDADDAAVEAAAQAAGIHDVIAALPQGYDSVAGENGVRLSGGQRQRVCVARAFLKNPPVLLLDEATASLDGESERAVQEALDRLRDGRTVVTIAHRLSTVQTMDRIMLFDKGRIAAVGTHEELFETSPLYHRLCTHQMITGSRRPAARVEWGSRPQGYDTAHQVGDPR